MSYEGYFTKLCVNGHVSRCDASFYNLDDNPKVCPVASCGAAFAHYRETDETNGYDEEYPITHDAKVIEIGFTDEWHTDHYGNKYATKLRQFKPDPADVHWKRYDE